MNRQDRRSRALAVCLSLLAGYVDAIGFLALGGFFVSFMSGNSTELGVGLARGSGGMAVAGGLIAAFILGVILGALAGHAAKGRRGPAVLGLVCLLLTAAAALAPVAEPLALGIVAMAMGAENNVFQRQGEVSVGVTYMTGTLVKVGQHLAAALLGGNRLAWLPNFLLWLGLVAGAVCGALLYPRLGLEALWGAAALAGVLALAAAAMGSTG